MTQIFTEADEPQIVISQFQTLLFKLKLLKQMVTIAIQVTSDDKRDIEQQTC